MIIDEDRYINFSLALEDTLLLRRVPGPSQPEFPIVARTPKKTFLEQMPPSGTTSTIMQAIRKVRVERLPEYFEQTCDRRPRDIAVICGSSQLTYQELDRQANRLAHFLISRGIRNGDPIGILLEHSFNTYVALLGVLKAGAAFVPLDPAFPPELIAFILEDAGLRGLVTTSAFREKTSVLPCPILELDRAYETLSVQQETRPEVRVDPASLCYIIYKPGTSGQPEGVAFAHANIVNFLRAITPIFRVTRDDRVYQGMSTASDHSFEEIWPTWIAGAALVTNPGAFRHSGHELTEFLIQRKITVLCCTPEQLAAIERDVPSLRSLFVGGEVCPAYLVNRWARPRRRMLNTYGCTETTITATWCEMFPGRPVTLGAPLPTYHIYILDNRMRPVKDGETGQLYIGGPGVAMGYLNRPDLMRERFIPNPVLRDWEMMPRLYRTGNLGRITPAGEIEYLGQINTQMKPQGDSIKAREMEQWALIFANTLPLNTYPTVPRFENGASAEASSKRSKLSVLRRLSIKNIYTQVMTDPLYRNSIFNMASTFILGGLGFFFWIIIARLYKTEDVGIATTLISVMTLLSGFSIMGFNVSLNRYLPKSIHKNDLINSSFVIATCAAILASAVFFLGLQIFSPQLLFLRSNIFYIISFTVFVIICSWNTLAESVFMAFRAASNILIKNTTISLLKLVLPFALIVFGAYGIFVSAALALTLGVLFSIIVLIIKFKIRPSISVNIPLLKETSCIFIRQLHY